MVHYRNLHITLVLYNNGIINQYQIQLHTIMNMYMLGLKPTIEVIKKLYKTYVSLKIIIIVYLILLYITTIALIYDDIILQSYIP